MPVKIIRTETPSIDLRFRSPTGQVTTETVWREDVIVEHGIPYLVLDIAHQYDLTPGTEDDWYPTGRIALSLQRLDPETREGFANPRGRLVNTPGQIDTGPTAELVNRSIIPPAFTNASLEPCSPRRPPRCRHNVLCTCRNCSTKPD